MSSAPTPPQRPKNVIWIILGIVGGGFILLVFFGFLIAGIVIRHTHMNDNGRKVEIETPVGAIRVNSDDRHSTGLPVYPGATAVTDEGSSVDLEFLQGAGLGIASEKYTTRDNLDQVSAWYAQKLGPSYRREEHGFSVPHGRVGATSDADVAFVNDNGKRGNGARVVALTRKEGRIEIELVRVGKKEVQ